jgi:glutamate formiminotransferase
VNLATDQVDLARKIARTVRASSGGLPALKAMGVALVGRGIVQVSMNLTDYTRTSLVDAFEAVRCEAERAGVPVIESELVGLAPAAALDARIAAAIGLVGYSARRLIEQAIAGQSPDRPVA